MLKKEREWVQALLKGEKAAGEWFVSEHYPRVYRLLYHLSRNGDVAQDLTQQTFMKAWQAVASFRNHSLIRTWLCRIAWHEYLRWKRDAKETASLEFAEDLPDVAKTDALLALDVANALARLSEEHRGAFLLYHVHELSIAEVAEVLGVPQGTVKSRLFTARQSLRELLQDEPKRPALNPMQAPLPVAPALQETTYEEVQSSTL